MTTLPENDRTTAENGFEGAESQDGESFEATLPAALAAMREEMLKEPSLVAFYIPLRWPLAMKPISRFTNMREETLPFDPPVSFPDWFGIMEPERNRNFVLISVHQFDHTETFDIRLMDYASQLAAMTSGGGFGYTAEGEKSKPEPQFDGEGNELNFDPIPPPSSEQPASVVELLTPVFEVPGDDWDLISRAFNRCIEELNLVEAAYAMTAHDMTVRYTNRVTSVPIIPIVLYRANGATFHKGSMSVNYGLHLAPYDREELTAQQMRDVATRVLYFKNGQPLIRFAERSMSANRAVEVDGDYAAAVLWIFTAGEILLDSLLLMMAWEELTFGTTSNVTFDEVVGWFSGRATLSGRVETLYHPRLKGGWDPGAQTCPLHAWSTEVAGLRNLVVHAGYLPTEAEARRAISDAEDLETFIKRIISDDKNRTRYPRTVFMILGIEGLEKRGLMKGKLLRLIRTEDVDWQQSFRAFRKQFTGALAATRPARQPRTSTS